MELVRAPFTFEQVENLNQWQVGGVHEFTCPTKGTALIATEEGWICPCCDHIQNWAHDFMADGSGLKAFNEILDYKNVNDSGTH